MNSITKIAQAVNGLLQETECETFSDAERQVHQILVQIGQASLQEWAHEKEKDHPELSEWNGKAIKYDGRRPARTKSLYGWVRYERDYYRYTKHKGGVSPFDEVWGMRPNAMSAEVERIAALYGVELPFDKASQLLKETLLLSLSDHSLDKATQRYGQEVAQIEAEWTEAAAEQRVPPSTVPPPKRLYATLDETSVHIREGKETAWRKLKMGAWFTTEHYPPTTPDDDWEIKAVNRHVYADLCSAEEFGPLFWATGLQRAAHHAEELVVIADGARWIWDLVEQYFPDAIQIIDWFHAVEYLAPVAQAAYKSVFKQQRWMHAVKQALWEGRIDEVIRACHNHLNPDNPHPDVQKAVTYFTNNRHRMDYQSFRDQGLQIGSGTIESAAKQIGQQRLKVPGATWNPQSARYVTKAKAASLSTEQWATVTSRRVA